MDQRLCSDPAWHLAGLGDVLPAAQRRGVLVGVDRARDVGSQARLAGGAGPNREQGGSSGYSGRISQGDYFRLTSRQAGLCAVADYCTTSCDIHGAPLGWQMDQALTDS